jgi:hypothetical protein
MNQCNNAEFHQRFVIWLPMNQEDIDRKPPSLTALILTNQQKHHEEFGLNYIPETIHQPYYRGATKNIRLDLGKNLPRIGYCPACVIWYHKDEIFDATGPRWNEFMAPKQRWCN